VCDEKKHTTEDKDKRRKVFNVSISDVFLLNQSEQRLVCQWTSDWSRRLMTQGFLTLEMLTPERNQKHLELAFQLV
jgi:hypothetical protein